MDIREAYKMMQAASGIEVGDTVKMLREFKRYEMGCNLIPSDIHGAMIGETYIVNQIEAVGDIRVNGGSIAFNAFLPFFCLELIAKGPPPIKIGEHTVETDKDGITVGCESVPWETLEKILEQRPK